MPFRFGVYAEGMLQRTRGQCDLLYRKHSNTFFLAITVDAPEPTPAEAMVYLGVDLGVITLAATSDGEFLNHSTGPKHAHINQVRARYSRFRAEAPEEGHEVGQAVAQEAQRAREALRQGRESLSVEGPCQHGERHPARGCA